MLDEIQITEGEEVEITPAETAFRGEALHLHDEEHQEAFTEAEVRTVKLVDGELIFAVEMDEPLAEYVVAKIWMMGYRGDTALQDMPKIFMTISSDEIKVYDGNGELTPNSDSIVENPTRIEFRVPLSLLGDPERVQMAVQTHFGDVPLDNDPGFT